MNDEKTMDARERYLTDAPFHARCYVAAEAMHRESVFHPDWMGWPCEECLTRAVVALDAADAAEAPVAAQLASVLEDFINWSDGQGASEDSPLLEEARIALARYELSLAASELGK